MKQKKKREREREKKEKRVFSKEQSWVESSLSSLSSLSVCLSKEPNLGLGFSKEKKP